ncbi:MAG TPA: DUF697 domain-containing protein [Longimicrobiales bacterium]
MRRTLLRIALFLSAFVTVAFIVFLVNQTAQLVALADRAHPLLGDALFWTLIALYAFCLLVPAFLILRLPPPLVPPEDETSAEFERHIERLTKRLRANPLLRGQSITERAQIESALAVLDRRADEMTKAAGAQVFLATAVSQNGSLDGFIVLAAQSKLVWEIARVYNQRPTLRDMMWLYGNVASTAFVAGELEDIDLSEQVQPILSSIAGSAAGAIPGLQAASTLFVTSVMTGAANALLTMRVGIITKQYSRALATPQKRIVRRTALVQATGMLGVVVMDGAKRVWDAIVTAAGRRVTGAFTGAAAGVRSATGAWAGYWGLGRKEDPGHTP